MPKNVPPLLMLIAVASDVEPATIYRISKELKEKCKID